MKSNTLQQEPAEISQSLLSNLVGEIQCMQEVLEAVEAPAVGLDEIVHLIVGIQRDIVTLYRTAQA